ncbi:hypothetical protein GCM10007079_37670 [Nocardiopsis terrae]|uniref:Secreted protein n=1 Tax=Nocardiopsis terrae TaxID=372655 RepID=A0ABR9HDT5_9ACTN|nr:hypothetical protein [Nocardiopsis terrae]MBE1457157.1 hypothetical protein [Nocardiopsis terrae]GHC90931.1 hypothetical protein GCM10007079_37670 [Nocardiopsis terrae]
MFELPAFGPLIAVAVPIAVIFLVLGIFWIVQRQAEKAVRSPDYWDEVPDGKRYPTGWGEEPAPTEPVPDEPDNGSERKPREGRAPGDGGDASER